MKATLLIVLTILTFGCCSSCRNNEALHSTHEREMTLGVVQKEVRPGMNQRELVEALGSPNIVTKDQNGTQSWVYDKIASEVSYSQDHGGFWLIVAGYGKDSGARASAQKTLTVVIKFDEHELVDKVSYHSSKF